MKTSTWIKLIGILCIIFGASGILNDVVSILFPEMTGMVKEKLSEVSPDALRWVLKLQYITLLTNMIYLAAGIFFLMKKPFSLKIMYIALTLSILCRIVPMLFFSQYSSNPISNYEIYIFSILGPFIDVTLLIGVCWLAKYYFKSDDKLIKPFGEYILTPRLLKLLTFLGLVCMLIPFSIQGLWIYSASSGINQVESVTTYNSYFPDFLRDGYAINYLSIVFCILAIIFSLINLRSSGNIWKANMIIMILGSLLLLLNLFQMM